MSVPRRTVVLWSAIGGVIIILASALGWVGVHLDQARIDRDTLQQDVDSLQQDYDSLLEERDTLQRQNSDHVKTIEQLQGEMERRKGGESGTPTTSSTPSTTTTP